MTNNLYNQLNQTTVREQTNPQLVNVIKEIKSSGLTAQDLFYLKVKQMGIDPNTILNKLR